MAQLRILIVEDEMDAAEIMEAFLAHYDIITQRETTAESALAALSRSKFDAAIIDMFLPGMDGVELIQNIRRHPGIHHLPCIAVTAYNSTTLKRQAIEAGYNRYYAKPIDPAEIVQELHRLLA